MFNLFLTLLCVLFFPYGLWSQNKIEQKFENAHSLLHTDRDSAIGLIENIDLSILPKEEQGLFHKQAAEFFGMLALFSKQVYHYKSLIDVLPDNSDTSFYYYRYLSLSQANSGDTDAALKTLKLAKAYYEKKQNARGLVATYNGLGTVHTQLGELKKGINYFLYAIKICDQQNDMLQKAIILGNLGIAYRTTGEYNKVLTTYLDIYEIVKKADIEEEIKFTELGIGGAYNNLEKYDSAIFYLEPLQAYYQENFNAQILNAIYNELGRSYSSLKQNDKAEEYFLKSIALLRDGGFDFALPGTLANYGKVLHAKGEFIEGIRVCQEALPIAIRTKYLEVEMIVCDCLYENFKGAKISDSALYYLENKLVLKDSLSNIELQKSVLRTELNMQHDDEKRSIKLASDSEINQVKSYSIILIVVCLMLILGVLFMYYVYKQRKKTNESIEREKEYLDNLLHNLVHEFRTPLTLIKGPVEELLKHDNQNRLLNMVNRNSDQMLNLVNQVLDFAKIKAGKLEVTPTITDLNVFLTDIFNLFLPLANARGIQLELQINITNPVVAIDSDKLFKILSNLISNAIKYSKENGHVVIIGNEKNTIYTFEIVDDGIGISTHDLQQVFEKFYQVDATLTRKGEGTGLGLAFVKELAELMNGKISIESILNKGTTIRFEIKVEVITSSSDILPKPKTIKEAHYDESIEHFSLKEDASRILIIEDNRDMQLFLQELMIREGYEVIIAHNGKIGVEKGLDIIPDLIITDVMMPIMGGFQVIQEMKSNEKTDHIPIIVLTAKASFDSKLEGLTYGADDYISKPFSSDELMLRIKNQLNHQEKIRSKFGSTEEKVIPKLEEHKFLLKIKEIMQADFSVQISAEEMAVKCSMSRSQLHRKLIALTGMSASALFTKIRLEFVYEDLINTDLTISEIAYKFGYSDPARLSKVFKKEYNSTPSELRL